MLRKMRERYRKCCVKCGTVGCLNIHKTNHQGVRSYKCTACKKTFVETYGTVFHKSKIPISKWLLALIYWVTATGSISAADLARKLGISHISAWRMLMKVRKSLNKSQSKEMLSGLVEADEAWFGRKSNQSIVMGLVERKNRKLRLMIVPNVKESSLYPLVRKNVKVGSKFFTDSRISYAATNVYYHHQTTNHSKGEFARKGGVHSNTIEQIWGDIKGIIRTIHHGVSKKYRHLYLAQYAFSYQARHSSNLFFNSICQLFLPPYCFI